MCFNLPIATERKLFTINKVAVGGVVVGVGGCGGGVVYVKQRYWNWQPNILFRAESCQELIKTGRGFLQ